MQTQVFERFEAYTPRTMDITGGAEPQRVMGSLVTSGLFPMLGVEPAIGRGFAADEGYPGTDHVVLISDALWRQRFGSATDVLGRALTLNDEPFTIVGVMPRRFRLLSGEETFWRPLALKSVANDVLQMQFYGLGRLQKGLTAASAQQLADSTADRLQQASPLQRSWDLQLDQKRIARLLPSSRTALLVLLGAVSFVLLIACANVAGLFLARTAARERELAVRAALGASRGRLVFGVLIESLILAAAAGVLGTLLAGWFVALVIAAAPPNFAFMATTAIEVDGRIIAVAGLMTLATGFGFGLLPALRGSRPDLKASLHGLDKSTTVGLRHSRLSGGLLVGEVALAFVLLIGTMLMIRTMTSLLAIDPGFQPRDLVTFNLNLPTDRYPSQQARDDFFHRLFDRLGHLPGAGGAAIAMGVPPERYGIEFGKIAVEGGDLAGSELRLPMNYVTPDYFNTLKIPVIAGRTFEESEHFDSNVVIVSEALARHLWPDGAAVGRRFRIDERGPWLTVVGVVGNTGVGVASKRETKHIYHPWAVNRTTLANSTGSNRQYVARVVVVRIANAGGDDPHHQGGSLGRRQKSAG